MTAYFVAVAVQISLPNGVGRAVAYGIMNSEPGSTPKPDDYVDCALVENNMSDRSKYRVVATIVCKNVPFDEPTKCRLYVTLMPSGLANNAIHLRQATMDVVISREYDMQTAFKDLFVRETGSDNVIGFGWSPLVLP